MAVVVYNKGTGKYLKRHSGSYHDARWHIGYKKGVREKVIEELGPCPPMTQSREPGGDTPYKQWCRKASEIHERFLFCAEPGDARVYANEGSALNSVGVWKKDFNHIPGRRKIRSRELPSYLEIHEIKEAFACIMRPDGSSNCDEGDPDNQEK